MTYFKACNWIILKADKRLVLDRIRVLGKPYNALYLEEGLKIDQPLSLHSRCKMEY